MTPGAPTTEQLGKRFSLRGLLLLGLAFVAAGWVAVLQLRELSAREASARARLVADDVVIQVQRALQARVPLDRLVGVEALFDHRLLIYDDLVSIQLQDANGKLLHARDRQRGDSDAFSLGAPVLRQTTQIAKVELRWRQPSALGQMLAWALPLGALFFLTAALASEALRYDLSTRVGRRDRLVAQACRRILSGRFDFRLPRVQRREFDTRLPWLSGQLRHLGEQSERVKRLASSLRRTESDANRRAALDRILQTAQTDDLFKQTPERLVDPTADAARQRWRGVLLGLGAWVSAAVLSWTHGVGAALAGFPMAAVVLMLAARLSWWRPDHSGKFGALIGCLTLGPGAMLLGLRVAAPSDFDALGPWGVAGLCAACLGAMALSWVGVPTGAARTSADPNDKGADVA